MDKEYQKYIRLTTEGVWWANNVAKCVGEHDKAEFVPKMYAFLGAHNIIRYVPESEAEFISAREYFAEVLKGKEFNDDV